MSIMGQDSIMAGSLTGLRGQVFKRYRQLENERSSWRTHWSELTDYLLPRRGRYLLESQNSKGRKRSSKIVDSTASQALRTLSAGLMSGMTSPARPWFRLQTEDPELMDSHEVKVWLSEVETHIRKVLSSSNFYNVAHTTYNELGAFGTACIMRQKHPTKGAHYRPFTAGEYVLAENRFYQTDTMGREFTMTVAQIVETFVIDKRSGEADWTKVSNAVKNLWNQRNYDTLVPVIHMIQPRRESDVDPDSMRGDKKKWMDVYVESGADRDVVLSEGGYNEFPIYAPRWDVLAGEVYGVSPGMEALGDIKQLQHEQKRKAQALDKMVNPPMVASNQLKGKPTTVLPGGTTYVDPIHGGAAGFQPAYTVQPRVNELMMDIQEVQERIQRGFYADLFAMMINSDRRQMTATEVAERHEEKLVLLGPVLQRLNNEFLDPLIEDLFLDAIRSNRLPPAPQQLAGVEVDIKYVSLLAQAQEAVTATTIERTLAFAGNLVAVDPEILDNVDRDEALRQYSDVLGNSPTILRSKDEVSEIRQRRAQQQEAMMAAEQGHMAAQTVNQGAQAAKVLSEADTQSPNALTALLQASGGGGRASI